PGVSSRAQSSTPRRFMASIPPRRSRSADSRRPYTPLPTPTQQRFPLAGQAGSLSYEAPAPSGTRIAPCSFMSAAGAVAAGVAPDKSIYHQRRSIMAEFGNRGAGATAEQQHTPHNRGGQPGNTGRGSKPEEAQGMLGSVMEGAQNVASSVA